MIKEFNLDFVRESSPENKEKRLEKVKTQIKTGAK